MESLEDADQIICHLADVEYIADDILMDRQKIVDLDRQRNENREASRALKNLKLDEGKSWVCLNNTFIKFSKESVKEFIEKDQLKLNEQIENLRKGLKTKVNHLNEVEGKSSEASKWNLKSLDKDELATVTFRS